MTTLTEQLQGEQNYLTDLRRIFHQHPELGLREYWTAERIEEELDSLGIAHERIGETGILGIIDGLRRGSGTIALRADIDGLPVQETNDVPYRSTNDGVMHACGHDSHIAVLLGAAKVLHNARGSYGGRVKLIFQPRKLVTVHSTLSTPAYWTASSGPSVCTRPLICRRERSPRLKD